MSERFYVNSALATGPVIVSGAEARHLAAVCRVRPGDAVWLFNGDGFEYAARVETVSKKSVTLEVTSKTAPIRERESRLELAVAMPKADRADWIVEKLTELGVARLIPLRTERGVVQPGEGRLERWRRIVIAASKQCGRNRLMEIAPLTDWAALLSDPNLPMRRLMVDPAGACGPWERGELVAAVGPEGGWTDSEIAAALEAGWERVSLGPRILRIETAAIVCAGRVQD